MKDSAEADWSLKLGSVADVGSRVGFRAAFSAATTDNGRVRERSEA